jgi:hypothetical protein
MKKILTLSMVGLLVLSIAGMAFGVDFDYSMGGRYYAYFSSIDGDRGFNAAPGVDAWDTILGATVKGENNTWATIKFIADSWNQKIYHSFGIDNIGGSPWSLGFDSHDNGTTNLGQQFMGDLFNDFKADPFFNTCDMAGSINVKYITDTFELRSEAKVYDSDGSTPTEENKNDEINEAYALGLIFKSDMGKYYIGAKIKDNDDQHTYDDPLYIAGADLQLNDLGVKIDFWSDKSGVSGKGEFQDAFWSSKGHQTLQTTLTYDNLTGQLLYSQPEEDLDDVVGVGVGYQFTPELNLGIKYFMVDESKADDGFYDVYGMYNVGAWDLKFGVSNAQFPYGQDGDKNEGGNYNDKQAFESEDPFFYVGVHFEF